MYEVILHEYTHILTFEPSNSFYSPLRYLFGSVVKPNALLPLWYQEGSAVLMETAFTKYGRLRSPLYSAQLRAYTQDDLLERESFDQINSTSVPTWPYGQRPYFFGSLITNEIAQKKDLKSIGLLNQSYSKRIPFLIQNPAKEIVGKNYFELFDEFKKNLKQKAKDQIARIKKHQNYKLIPLDIASTSQTLPRISPDGSY